MDCGRQPPLDARIEVSTGCHKQVEGEASECWYQYFVFEQDDGNLYCSVVLITLRDELGRENKSNCFTRQHACQVFAGRTGASGKVEGWTAKQ